LPVIDPLAPRDPLTGSPRFLSKLQALRRPARSCLHWCALCGTSG